MPRRGRRASVLALLAVLAGCAGLPGPPAAGPTADTRTPSPTPEPTPRPYPDHPDRLDADAATSLAVACERALVWNERVAARDGVVGLEFEASAGNVATTGDGWVVNLSVDATVVYVEPMDEHVGHLYRVTYVVDEAATRRTNVTGRPPQLLPDGVVGSC